MYRFSMPALCAIVLIASVSPVNAVVLYEIRTGPATNQSTILNAHADVASASDFAKGSGIAYGVSGTTFNVIGFDVANTTFADALADDEVITWSFALSKAYDLDAFGIGYDRVGNGPKNIRIELDTGGGFTQVHLAENYSDTVQLVPTIDLSAFDAVTAGTFRITLSGAASSGSSFRLENDELLSDLPSPQSASFRLLGTLAPEPDVDPLTMAVVAPDRLVGAPFSQNVTLSEVGGAAAPFTLTPAADATIPDPGSSPIAANGSTVIGVGLDVSAAGARAGSVTVNDGNADVDEITVTGNVFDLANASFDVVVNQDLLSLNFGAVVQGSGTLGLPLTISNLLATPGFTAGLDFDTILGSGDIAALFPGLVPAEFADLSAGTSHGDQVFFDTSLAPGVYVATYTITLSNSDALAGADAAPAQTLTLELRGEILARTTAASIIPEPATLSLLGFAAIGLGRRRRVC